MYQFHISVLRFLALFINNFFEKGLFCFSKNPFSKQIFSPPHKYSFLYENDHFNQAQAEFKKEANGQSKQVAQKKRVEKRSVCTMHSGTSLVHTLQKMDHLRPSISLLLQLSVLGRVKFFFFESSESSWW